MRFVCTRTISISYSYLETASNVYQRLVREEQLKRELHTRNRRHNEQLLQLSKQFKNCFIRELVK